MTDEIDTEKEKGLPFSENNQDGLLGYLIDDDRFFQMVRHHIKPEYFLKQYNQKIYAAKVAFAEEYGRLPRVAELKDYKEFMMADMKTRTAIWTQIESCRARKAEYGLDFINSQLTEWVRSNKFKLAHTRSAKQYNANKTQDAFDTMVKAMDDIKTVSFTQDLDVSFASPKKLVDEIRREYSEGLTFGISHMDNLLNPEAPKGPLLRGDTTVILAPANVGKTTAMMSIAVHNIIKGKHVLFMTHEGKVLDLQLKFLCSIMGVTRKEFFDRCENNEFWVQQRKALMLINRYLTFVPFNRAGMTVEDVIPVIRRYQDRKLAQTGGKHGYDMLVNDYPAKLTTRQAERGNLNKRHIDDIVYGTFVQLGLEYNFHVLCCIQANREGSKINKGIRDTDRMLEMEDANESYGPMQSATNVISANRGPLAEIRHRIAFHICKSRGYETGWTVVCRSAYPRYMTHSEELGGVWYKGNGSLADKIDDLMKQHNNAQLPVQEQVAAS